MDESQMHMLSKRNQTHKGTDCRTQRHSDRQRKQISICQGWELRENLTTKSILGNDLAVLYLDCGPCYTTV